MNYVISLRELRIATARRPTQGPGYRRQGPRPRATVSEDGVRRLLPSDPLALLRRTPEPVREIRGGHRPERLGSRAALDGAATRPPSNR